METTGKYKNSAVSVLVTSNNFIFRWIDDVSQLLTLVKLISALEVIIKK